VWFVALRPGPADTGEAPAPVAQEAPAAPGTEGLNRAVDRANEAVTTANGGAQQEDEAPASAGDAEPPRSERSGDARISRAERAEHVRHARRLAHAASRQVGQVRAALRQRKAIAIAFVDPLIADARAVEQELRAVSLFDGKAFTTSVPLARLSQYGFITRGVEVTVAPTRKATAVVGAADRGEIEQRLADALLAKRR
jgi:hypothetical protein